MPKILTESREAQSFHLARNAGSGVDPCVWACTTRSSEKETPAFVPHEMAGAFLDSMELGSIRFIFLQHQGDSLVGNIALHLGTTDGANVDATRPYYTGALCASTHASSCTSGALAWQAA